MLPAQTNDYFVAGFAMTDLIESGDLQIFVIECASRLKSAIVFLEG